MARELLARSPMRLAEIAVACGFTDQSHFSRVFARFMGTSPGPVAARAIGLTAARAPGVMPTSQRKPGSLRVLDTHTVSVDQVFCFGPFRLLPTARVLLEGDTPVQLGSRALEALLVLLERPGELVSKETLTARVWPNTVVVEANLPVQVTALRRALRDGREGNRYILNVPGRGYRFVAPVIVADELRYPPPPSAQRFRHDFAASVMRLLDVSESDSDVARILANVGAGVAQPHAPAIAGQVPSALANTSMHSEAPRLSLDERALAATVLQRGIWALEFVQTLIAGPRNSTSAP